MKNNNLIINKRNKIRLYFLIIFIICLAVSYFIDTGIKRADNYINRNSYKVVEYDTSRIFIENNVRDILDELTFAQRNLDKEEVADILNKYTESKDKVQIKLYITDIKGKVLSKSENADEKAIETMNIIRNTLYKSSYDSSEESEYIRIYPVNVLGGENYIIAKARPKAKAHYSDYYGYREVYPFYGFKNTVFPLIRPIVFVVLFILLTSRKLKYFEEVLEGIDKISEGSLDYKIKEEEKGEIGYIAQNINCMCSNLKDKIEKEKEEERSKNELVTNISHDLRTPLTSVIGYLKAIKDNKYENDKQMKEYVDIAYRKSEKLKVLIEDLFEYTKLSSPKLSIKKEMISVKELIDQLAEEFVPACEDEGLKIDREIEGDKFNIIGDGEKLARVFENLITNAIRYSYKPGIINIKLTSYGKHVTVSVSNKGDNIPKEKVKRLFERFYRVDESRNEETGGSGLGLAIAKTLVELNDGVIWADCIENDITFYVKLPIALLEHIGEETLS